MTVWIALLASSPASDTADCQKKEKAGDGIRTHDIQFGKLRKGEHKSNNNKD